MTGFAPATLVGITAQLQAADTMFAQPGFAATSGAANTMEGMCKNLEAHAPITYIA